MVALQNGTEHRVALGDGRVQVCALLDLPMSIRLETRLHGAVAVYRGPLLYSLPVQSKIRVPLFAARTLNAVGQYRVTLSLQKEHLRAARGPCQEERSLIFAQKRSS